MKTTRSKLAQGAANGAREIKNGIGVSIWPRPDANKIDTVGALVAQVRLLRSACALWIMERGFAVARTLMPPAVVGRLAVQGDGDAVLMGSHAGGVGRGRVIDSINGHWVWVFSGSARPPNIERENMALSFAKWVCRAVISVVVVVVAAEGVVVLGCRPCGGRQHPSGRG